MTKSPFNILLTQQGKAAAPAQPTGPIAPCQPKAVQPTGEIGGQQGPEPTRFGDWEKSGRCTDF